MKKIIIFTIISLVFVTFGCKKDKSLDAGACSVSNEKVEASYSSATISGSFASNGTVETMNVVYGETFDLKSANSLPCALDANSFSVGISDLSSATKYYYCFEFSNKYSSVMTDVKSFQTFAATIPTVVTGSVSEITQTSAVCGGEVTNDGGAEVTVRGVCWSTTQNPTLSDAHNANGSGTGSYIVNMPALTANTTYYVRAYAKNSVGLAFGEVKQFKTNEIIVKPTVTTVEIKNITALSAVTVGNVTADGGAEITSRGFCWSKSENPTIEDSHIEVEGTTCVFEGSLLNLEANKKYHVRAFATNSAGTSYGEELSFTTAEGLPVVVTSSVTEITATTAKCGGNVTDQGASNVTERGICWSINHNPTIADSHVSGGGSGTGTYTCQMTSLTPNATYYVRAYAKNAQGISYGSEVNFIALEGLPSVITSAVTNITSTSATGGGNVTNQGASNVTDRGVCWGTEHNPTIEGSHASSGSGAGAFTIQITNLIAGTKYYVRAYAKNSQGTSYGTEVEFTTLATLPTVTTGSVTDITESTATGSGEVTDDGGATVTERGICWSTTANPTSDGDHVASGSGTGLFTAKMTSLTAGTTYHVRAYATNSAGTAYGNDVTFTTEATLPTVITSEVSNITQTTAQSGGYVTSDGGAIVTERGVCWSLDANPTTADSHVASGTGTGDFVSNITGLTANTTYHVRAYATNSQGTSYGSDITFTTSQSISAPTVTTATITNITQTTATGGGNVTADGGATVTERGICWGTSQSPTTSGTHASSGTGTGEFTVQISGLTANTTYYVRAYAVNSAGTSYGNEVSFTTLQNVLIVNTGDVINITQTTAQCIGVVDDEGTSAVVERGVCWSNSHNPNTSNNHVSNGSGTGSFTAFIVGLTAGTTYYVRAYAINESGTGYGEEKQFTSLATCTGIIDGRQYVDMGLPSGILWATCNQGATTQEDSGDRFAWGEVASKSVFDRTNYTWWSYYPYDVYYIYKYNTIPEQGVVDNKTVLEISDDAAAANNRGGHWRMPTKEELQEIIDNCTENWIEMNNVYGMMLTGPNGNSIFFPTDVWSSTLYTKNCCYAYFMGIAQSGCFMNFNTLRCEGVHVRPVYSLNYKPEVELVDVTHVSTTEMTCRVCVTEDSGTPVTARGVCWGTSHNPTINDNHTTDGSGVGEFTSSISGVTENVVYYVRAYATNSVGTNYSKEKCLTSIMNGHEYVDLGLPSGILWATCNVGANSVLEYGSYFAWGETSPKNSYTWSNYQWGGENSLTKYCANDNLTVLEPSDDAAHVIWGGNWRMPTYIELNELVTYCTCLWHGNCCSITGPNGNKIFLPNSGYRDGNCLFDDYWGDIWSSSLGDYDYTCSYFLRCGTQNVFGVGDYPYARYFGMTIRPVFTP